MHPKLRWTVAAVLVVAALVLGYAAVGMWGVQVCAQGGGGCVRHHATKAAYAAGLAFLLLALAGWMLARKARKD